MTEQGNASPPVRKSLRLGSWNYAAKAHILSQYAQKTGSICFGKRNLLSHITVGAHSVRPPRRLPLMVTG
ncbi:MAG: hypothetical protein LUD83_06360, partial [Clostridiales bacterium]|nr:hypothetical protein [Clostridiales bacterium]